MTLSFSFLFSNLRLQQWSWIHSSLDVTPKKLSVVLVAHLEFIAIHRQVKLKGWSEAVSEFISKHHMLETPLVSCLFEIVCGCWNGVQSVEVLWSTVLVGVFLDHDYIIFDQILFDIVVFENIHHAQFLGTSS